MAVWVDQASIMWRGKARHHMTADNVDELHAFAVQVGIRRCWFHNKPGRPHYDVTDGQRTAALNAGAVSVSTRQLLEVARRCR